MTALRPKRAHGTRLNRRASSLFASLAVVWACSELPERPELRDVSSNIGETGGDGGAENPPGSGGVPDESPSSAGAGGTAGAAGDSAGGGAGGEPASIPECGDGTRDGSEECDDANQTDEDGCSADCRIELRKTACGDGQVKDWEECDDGNLNPGDGCDGRCRTERCGNKREDVGEECDPPDLITCGITCKIKGPRCGDGVVQTELGEECDDRNTLPGDGCHTCRETCGDGRIDRTYGEECEPAYSTPEQCSAVDCRWLPVCGDGEVQPEAGEQCDPSDGVDCVDCRSAMSAPGEGGAGGVGGVGGAGGSGEEPDRCVPVSSDLVQNGTFDTGATGWQPHNTTLVTQQVVEDGAPEPRALEVTLTGGATAVVSGSYQCVPVQPGRSYDLTASYYVANDATPGVAASITAFLYAGTTCDGAIVGTPATGPAGTVRGSWAPYQVAVNTSGLTSDGRALVRLELFSPAGATTSRVRWDNVVLAEPGGQCGNCQLNGGEQCDDGNRAPGDGCSASCQLEICGDGRKEPTEECEDGNTVFGVASDNCTPACRVPTACDACAATSCTVEAFACLNLTRHSEAGPRAKTAQSTLCDELRACVHETACDRVSRTSAGSNGQFLENCYCGTAGAGCFSASGLANGSCKAEVEAALETTDPAALLGRFDGIDPRYPVFAALRELLECEGRRCNDLSGGSGGSGGGPSQCLVDSACGNGRVQDRNFDYTFIVDDEEVPCRDEFTATGRGCSFEECDDGNLNGGDGCDQFCFVEACGNRVVQIGEECDDGNLVNGDGCNQECQAEFHCADSVFEPPGEECDPPAAGPVCSEAQFASNPAQCGCDSKCKRIVCGKNGVQTGEQCDPPNGVSCDAECKLLNASPCDLCLNTYPELAEPMAEFCTSRECVDVMHCAVEEQCMVPPLGAHNCYCGDNTFDCDAADFVPIGPCRDEIRAGVGSTATHQEIYWSLTTDEYPSGVALLILNAALQNGMCLDECFGGGGTP
jgi:cysteine-rich repeat protein